MVPGRISCARKPRLAILDNVLVLPYQPYEDYEHVLASADVLLAIVAETAGVLYIPSKTTSLLCAGRPIVMAANWRSVATSFLRQSNAGRVVPPEDVSAMANAILTYMDDANLAEQTGQQARASPNKRSISQRSPINSSVCRRGSAAVRLARLTCARPDHLRPDIPSTQRDLDVTEQPGGYQNIHARHYMLQGNYSHELEFMRN